jgi:hypothetical protein
MVQAVPVGNQARHGLEQVCQTWYMIWIAGRGGYKLGLAGRLGRVKRVIMSTNLYEQDTKTCGAYELGLARPVTFLSPILNMPELIDRPKLLLCP